MDFKNQPHGWGTVVAALLQKLCWTIEISTKNPCQDSSQTQRTCFYMLTAWQKLGVTQKYSFVPDSHWQWTGSQSHRACWPWGLEQTWELPHANPRALQCRWHLRSSAGRTGKRFCHTLVGLESKNSLDRKSEWCNYTPDRRRCMFSRNPTTHQKHFDSVQENTILQDLKVPLS